jgi:phage terminase large subunit-like protein
VARRGTATATAAPPPPPPADGRLTPAQVRAHPKWSRLLFLQPGYDPCAQAEGCYFDEAAALEPIEFIEEVVKHAKGPAAGKPFLLEDWQKCWIANLFGWKRSDSGLRRVTETLLYVPKKNSKTALAAALMVYALCKSPFGAELYSAAASQDQAGLLFAHVAGMVALDVDLTKALHTYGNKGGTVRKSIAYPERMASYKCLHADADTVDGVAPWFVVVDELHRHESPELSDVLHKSTAATPGALVIYTTTADYNRESACNTKLKYARRVIANKGDRAQPGFDPAFLPAVWEASVKDDWMSPATWRKANPNLGVTVSEEWMRREAQKAKETPSELNNFLRLHLNIVTDAAQAWLAAADWDRGAEPAIEVGHEEAWIAERGLEGRRCVAGLDLAKTTALTACAFVFAPRDPKDGYAVLMRFWMPRARMESAERRDNVPYSQWQQEGWLRVTEGDVTDYDVVRSDVVELCRRFKPERLAYDPWGATQMANQFGAEEIQCVEFKQLLSSFAEPTDEFERLVLSSRLSHGGHPILRWNAGNVSVFTDTNGNKRPSKISSTGHIDGIVSAIMALGVLILLEPEAGGDIEAAYAEEAIHV